VDHTRLIPAVLPAVADEDFRSHGLDVPLPGMRDDILPQHVSAVRSCLAAASRAGHDAQMMARLCPACMIFVTSVGAAPQRARRDHRPPRGGRRRAARRGAAAGGLGSPG
jgi:hypothetical protein